MVFEWRSWVKVVASASCLMLVVCSSGCDALNSVNQEKVTEQTVPAPVPPAPIAPPPVTPPPIVKTPQEIMEGILALPNAEKRDEHLQQLSELKEGLNAITTLDLSRSGVSDEGLKHLTAFPQLTELNLAETRVSNTGLVSVAEVKTLRSLTLGNLRGVDDLGVKHLSSLKELKSLTITACPVTDQVFTTLAELDGLQVLNLSICPDIYGKGFQLLTTKGHFKNLRELQVSGSKFGNYGMDQLNKLPQLEILRASRCEMAGATIMGLTGCDRLKVLDLSGNSFFDDNMKIVSRLKNLEELRLAQINGLTDESLNSLKIMKSLKILDLEGTRITEPAAKLLKEKFLRDTEIQAAGQKF